MAAQWPSSLPQAPLYNGYSRTLRDTRIYTDNSSGASKVRNKFTAGVEDVTYRFVLDAAQKVTLENFYKQTLKNGALPYIFKEPESGTDRQYRFAKGSTLKFEREGLYYIIELKLEVLP